MRKREVGQALILVLILLAVGVLLVVPALRLTATSLKSSQIVLPRVKALYAADAAQEFILWKLLHDGLAEELMYSADPNPSAHYDLDVCGALVSVTVYMRATVGMGGITLAGDDLIRPTKTVECEELGSEIPDDWTGTVTYTIRLEQLSSNTTVGLDAVYDILPIAFAESDYVVDSSYIRVDDGEWTQDIGEPSFVTDGGQVRLRWPYSGVFTSPIRDFAVRQVKEIRFELYHGFKGEDKDRVFYNWVLLKQGAINTFSGPQAPITVGAGTTSVGGLLEVSKTSYPEVIPPGVETDIEYTISITNLDGETHQIQEITDYLPPGFSYSDNSTSGITTSDPISSVENINGVDRQVLLWQFSPAVPIQSNETLTLTLWSRVTKHVSGSYYNEFTVIPATPIPHIFQPDDMDVRYADFNTTYSWNTGTVMVPAYDSSANATGVNINANMALILEGITITSWQVD